MDALKRIIDPSLRSSIEDVFKKLTNGRPDDISVAGCLELAKKGPEVWNAWRDCFPVKFNEIEQGASSPSPKNFANFSNLNLDNMDFQKFKLGPFCRFINTKFNGLVKFKEVIFDDEVSFEGAIFFKHANFQKTNFFKVNFSNVSFLNSVTFFCSKFRGISKFDNSKFYVTCIQEAKFLEEVSFIDAEFNEATKFTNSEFENVLFDRAKFKKETLFEGAKFFKTSFDEVKVFESISFENSIFNFLQFKNVEFNKVSFERTLFKFDVEFNKNKFNGLISFKQSIFLGVLNIHDATFDGNVIFSGASFATSAEFYKVNFNDDVSFEGKDSTRFQVTPELQECLEENENSLSLNEFKKIEFLGCKFEGEANFSNRIFKNSCTFGAVQKRDKSDNLILQKTTFAKAPKFHNCELHQDTSFDGAEFPEATGNEESARAYRTLKLAFNKMQAVREEQRFFKLELAEEAKASSGLYKFLYHSYYALSNFGFSVSKPLWWCLFSIIFFFFSYSIALHFAHCNSGLDCHIRTNWLSFNTIVLKFSLINALPLPGIEKIVDLKDCNLYASSGPIGWVITGLIFIQKLFSLVLLFLIGLALKNLFKFK